MEETEVVSEENAPEENAPEPVALETALAWLAAARPASVLTLLREPDYAAISVSAFAGFRVNAQGYANPLVRKRLAQEICKNELLADAVRALAENAAPAAPAPAAAPKSVSLPQPSKEEELKQQRDQRRRERDDARQERDEARRALTAETAARAQAQTVLEEQNRAAEHQAQRIARLERRLAQADAEKAALLKALRQDKVSPPPRQSSASGSSPRPAQTSNAASAWQEAVERLLRRGKAETALTVALDVLREAENDAGAIDIAARAYQATGSPREAAALLRRLFIVHLDAANISGASQALFHLLTLLPPPPDARREARRWLIALRSDDNIAAARSVVERLKRVAPPAYDWLQAEITQTAPRLADELMPPPGMTGPDDPLPLRGGWSARQLVQAVNANDVQIVSAVRDMLTREDDVDMLWAALARAAGEEDSVLVPLRRTGRGAILVDGSNAAWYDQHSYAVPRPRLRPILALRRALRLRGWFPVYLYADAPLPYTIDDPDALRALLSGGEMMLVDSGVDADEVLLREAKRLGVPLVTNDYMTDWDPHNEVEKLQYAISFNGEAHLLS